MMLVVIIFTLTPHASQILHFAREVFPPLWLELSAVFILQLCCKYILIQTQLKVLFRYTC